MYISKMWLRFGIWWNAKCLKILVQHTSSPILPFNEILIGLEWLVACINVVKWLMPISSSEDLRRPTDTPTFGNPWRNELERLNKISLSICWWRWNATRFHLLYGMGNGKMHFHRTHQFQTIHKNKMFGWSTYTQRITSATCLSSNRWAIR